MCGTTDILIKSTSQPPTLGQKNCAVQLKINPLRGGGAEAPRLSSVVKAFGKRWCEVWRTPYVLANLKLADIYAY